MIRRDEYDHYEKVTVLLRRLVILNTIAYNKHLGNAHHSYQLFTNKTLTPSAMNSDSEVACDISVYSSNESDVRDYVVICGYEPGCTNK